MLAPVTHILPVTTIRRERLLPVPGKVLVRKGQKVSASDIVAEANLNPEHLLLDISRGLGLPSSQADRHIHCKIGDQLAQGDVVAGPVGFTRRVVRTPRNGRVVLAGSGQVLLEVQSQPFELKAGVPGEVIDLYPDRGAVIKTTGALIQGVWGNGRIDYGLMYALASDPEQELTPDKLDVSFRGSIVLAGYCGNPEVLTAAIDLPLRGLILSSMDPSLMPVAVKAPFPVIVIEGLGFRPMNKAAFQLLSTNAQHEVVINAEAWDRFAGTRPEIIIPLPASVEPPLPPETDFFASGKQVRILRTPHVGKTGTLLDLRGPVLLPNGLRALAAEVRLENGENAILPLANLEILE